MRIAPIALLSSLVASANAVGFRELVERVTPKHSESTAVETITAAAAVDEGADQESRALSNCWGGNDPGAAWHPQYSAGWTGGYCRYTVDCNSPPYSSELACCKGAYAGQISGKCLSSLPNPPTTSPTDAGGLEVYYPDYDTTWTEAGCLNERPMPSGRPTYSTMLACCKGAYGGQMSGKCLSMLPISQKKSPLDFIPSDSSSSSSSSEKSKKKSEKKSEKKDKKKKDKKKKKKERQEKKKKKKKKEKNKSKGPFGVYHSDGQPSSSGYVAQK